MKSMPWTLWISQVLAILRLELKRNFVSKRAIPVYLLALMQISIFALHSFAALRGWSRCEGTRDLTIFAGVFQVFFLRLAVFFGCVFIFLNLFRGEVLEKTLHYYFLAPLRREVLVVGKFLAGFLAAAIVFSVSTAVSYISLMPHLAATPAAAAVGPAMGHLWSYLGVTLLACAGYGAVFLILGLYFRNPIIPAVLVLIWESFIIFLPPLLKKFSVIFYLESLCPVRVPFDGPGALFAIAANPTPGYIAGPGLVLLTVVVLALASLRIKRLEISYGSE